MDKYIYVVAGTLVVVALLYLLRNVFKRIFQATRFILMPHKYEIIEKEIPLKFAPLAVLTPLLSQISFKIIAYLIVIAVVGTVCLGLYHKITADTYSNDYRNNVHGNQAVVLDQRQQIDGISCFGISLGNTCLGIGHAKSNPSRTIDNTKVKSSEVKTGTEPKTITVTPTVVKKKTVLAVIGNTITAPFRWIRKVIK